MVRKIYGAHEVEMHVATGVNGRASWMIVFQDILEVRQQTT